MIPVKTESGFECTINELLADDMEFMDDIAMLDDEPQILSKLILKLLGKEQKKALYDHLRLEDGRVPIEETAKMFAEIMNQAGAALKNS